LDYPFKNQTFSTACFLSSLILLFGSEADYEEVRTTTILLSQRFLVTLKSALAQSGSTFIRNPYDQPRWVEALAYKERGSSHPWH